MKRKIILYSTTALLLLMAAQSATAQTKGKKPKSFSPKMLVYENLKNDNVLRHFKQRFAQLDTLINNPIWVKSPVIALGLNNQHHADINKTDSLFWSKTAHEHLALNRHNGLEVTGQVYARPDSYFDSDEDDAKEVSKYKMKVQAELGWNIINSKFYQGKEKRTKIALANELDRLQIKKRQTAGIYEKAADELTEQYNFYIGTVIAHRLDNLDIMNEAYQFMLEKDRISNDTMLKVMNDKLEAEYDISVLCTDRDISNKPIYRIKPTKIVVDTTALWNHLNQESLDARIMMVQADQLFKHYPTHTIRKMVELLAEQQQDFEQCRRGREIHHSYLERNATQTTGTGDPEGNHTQQPRYRCEGNKTVGRHPAQEDRQPEQGYSHRGFPYRPDRQIYRNAAVCLPEPEAGIQLSDAYGRIYGTPGKYGAHVQTDAEPRTRYHQYRESREHL